MFYFFYILFALFFLSYIPMGTMLNKSGIKEPIGFWLWWPILIVCLFELTYVFLWVPMTTFLERIRSQVPLTIGVLCYHSTGWNAPLEVIVSTLVDCGFESAMSLLLSLCLFFVYQEKGSELTPPQLSICTLLLAILSVWHHAL